MIASYHIGVEKLGIRISTKVSCIGHSGSRSGENVVSENLMRTSMIP